MITSLLLPISLTHFLGNTAEMAAPVEELSYFLRTITNRPYDIEMADSVASAFNSHREDAIFSSVGIKMRDALHECAAECHEKSMRIWKLSKYDIKREIPDVFEPFAETSPEAFKDFIDGTPSHLRVPFTMFYLKFNNVEPTAGISRRVYRDYNTFDISERGLRKFSLDEKMHIYRQGALATWDFLNKLSYEGTSHLKWWTKDEKSAVSVFDQWHEWVRRRGIYPEFCREMMDTPKRGTRKLAKFIVIYVFPDLAVGWTRKRICLDASANDGA